MHRIDLMNREQATTVLVIFVSQISSFGENSTHRVDFILI